MTKADNTFEFLVEYITAKVVERLIREYNISIEEALLRFHNSETFDKLCDKDNGLYIESPWYVYNIFQEEQRQGTIRGMIE